MAYTIKEIIDIAVGIEESGLEFYTRCSKKFKEPSISDVFEFLAREEQAHKELFQSLYGRPEPKGVFNDEYFAYIKAIGGRVFDWQKRDMDDILQNINKPLDAVQHAFIAEKDSILFYSEVKPMYGNNDEVIPLLDKIINEERKHVATLVDLADKLRLA